MDKYVDNQLFYFSKNIFPGINLVESLSTTVFYTATITIKVNF